MWGWLKRYNIIQWHLESYCLHLRKYLCWRSPISNVLLYWLCGRRTRQGKRKQATELLRVWAVHDAQDWPRGRRWRRRGGNGCRKNRIHRVHFPHHVGPPVRFRWVEAKVRSEVISHVRKTDNPNRFFKAVSVERADLGRNFFLRVCGITLKYFSFCFSIDTGRFSGTTSPRLEKAKSYIQGLYVASVLGL